MASLPGHLAYRLGHSNLSIPPLLSKSKVDCKLCASTIVGMCSARGPDLPPAAVPFVAAPRRRRRSAWSVQAGISPNEDYDWAEEEEILARCPGIIFEDDPDWPEDATEGYGFNYSDMFQGEPVRVRMLEKEGNMWEEDRTGEADKSVVEAVRDEEGWEDHVMHSLRPVLLCVHAIKGTR